MKCISVWISNSKNPDSFERVIKFPIDNFVNEVQIHLEEIEK